MSTTKRCISLLLVLGILLGAFAPGAQAASMVESPSVNTDAMTIEGPNGFGNLLAQEFTEKQQEDETAAETYPEGYCVSDLEITDDTATVAYTSMEEATLVVALYTEDGLQLITSATTVVTPDADEAIVIFDGEMPEYFYASAYLLDQYDYSPLCVAYNTPMYTQEMQELLASTVDDYDPDRVWNLDDDKTTNFAVYAESTTIIEPVEGINIVTQVDDENRRYVIKNADEQITQLSPGDVFVYTYAEQEMLIVKVGEIAATDATVTIIGADVDMHEVFEAVKVENESNTEDFVVDDSTADEMIHYVGLVEKDESDAGTLAAEDDFNGSVKHEFSVDNEDETVEGSLSVELQVFAYYYLSANWDYIEFRITQSTVISLTFRESILDREKTVPLGTWSHHIAGFLVVVSFEPELKLEVSGAFVYTRSITSTFGFIYEKGEKGANFKPIYESPPPGDKLEAEFNIYVGIDFGPSFLILDDDIFKVKLNLLIGLDFTYTILELSTDMLDENADEKHACISCSTIELKFKVELSVDIKVFSVNIPMDSLPTSGLYEEDWILGRWYISAYGSGAGICPNRTYRITMVVRDRNGAQLPNQDITISTLDTPVTTDQNGIAVCYLQAGKTEFFTHADGFGDTESIEIEGAQKIFLCLDTPIENISDESDFVSDMIEDELPEYVDRGDPMHEETFGDGLTWQIYPDGTLVIDGEGEIPNYTTCFEYPWTDYRKFISMVIIKDGITAVGDCAFEECINLSNVIIPNSVTTIGAGAFAFCRSLENVKIGGSVTNIGNSAFEDCSSLTAIELPESVTAIGDYAFSNCSNLTNAELGNSVTSIGGHAFKKCTKLANVEIPDSVTDIGNHAFEGCAKLASVKIPNSVTVIGNYVFSDCSSLTSVDFGSNITSIGIYAFSGCAELTAIELPDSVTAIGDYAFSGCNSMISADIGSGVTSIGEYAFEACTKLESIKIPDGVTSISDGVFWACHKLENIKIPDSVTSIGHEAFAGCDNLSSVELGNGVTILGDFAFEACGLENIEIPDSVTTLGNCTFQYCTSLTSVKLGSSITTLGNGTFNHCDKLESIVVPEGVTSIGGSVFMGCNSLVNVELGIGITSIGDSAFAGCNLDSIQLPNHVTSIGKNAFSYCTNLKNIELPNSVTTIDQYAFSGCIGLTQVDIPDSVRVIGDGVFSECSNLTGIWVNESNPYYSNDEEGILFDKDKTVLIQCPSAFFGEYKIPDGVFDIRERAFYRCDGLTAIHIPQSVTQIMDMAFEECHNLLNLEIPDCVSYIGIRAFSGCDKLTEVVIGTGVSSIGREAYSACTNLSSIIFRGDAPAIGQWAFSHDTATAYYPSGNATWTDSVKYDYGGDITWVPYTIDENGNMITGIEYSVPEISGNMTTDTVSPNAVYPGDYSTEITEEYTLKTASFTDLVPGQQYVLLVLADIEVQELLARSNLLFIDQGVAQDDGTLCFKYVQRRNTSIAYVMACGASSKDLNDAIITFPAMVPNGELQVVNPTVVYDGVTLTEGRDYAIIGTVSYMEEGTYTCTIRGINNYTGCVVCVYTVNDHNHSFTSYISDGNATCTEDGTKTSKCDYCDMTDTIPDVGSAMGHTFGAWVVIQVPTAIEEGLEEHTCTRCGYAERKSIAKLENPFTDVPEGSFYYEPVVWAVKNGITNGTSATTFSPNDQCMRAQVVTFLWRAAGSPEPESNHNPFWDVKESDFYYKAVLWAVENGITNGLADHYFGPLAYCNRAQVVTFLWRAKGQPTPDGTDMPFTDVTAGVWYEAPVRWAMENGITNGMSATSFGINVICNRAQIVTFLYRAYN